MGSSTEALHSGTMRLSVRSPPNGGARAVVPNAARSGKGAFMNQANSAPSRESTEERRPNFVLSLWGVRYQVKDVSRSVDFYTRQLGFKLDQKHLPAFAQVSIGNL